jgi:hypothetical protein
MTGGRWAWRFVSGRPPNEVLPARAPSGRWPRPDKRQPSSPVCMSGTEPQAFPHAIQLVVGMRSGRTSMKIRFPVAQ